MFIQSGRSVEWNVRRVDSPYLPGAVFLVLLKKGRLFAFRERVILERSLQRQASLFLTEGHVCGRG